MNNNFKYIQKPYNKFFNSIKDQELLFIIKNRINFDSFFPKSFTREDIQVSFYVAARHRQQK